MSVDGVLILPTVTNSIFRLVHDAENFNFLYFMQREDDIDAGYSWGGHLCKQSLRGEQVCGSVWHQTSSWYDFVLLSQCIFTSLEEGYNTDPQVLCFYSFLSYVLNKWATFVIIPIPEFPFILATDKGFIWWIAEYTWGGQPWFLWYVGSSRKEEEG